MSKNKILDIDSEFSNIEFDEHSITRHTAMKRVNSEKGAEVHKKKSESMKQRYRDPAYREYKATIQQDLAQTAEWQQAHARGIDKRQALGWHEKNLQARKSTLKPIQTPYGIFDSKKAAVAGMTQAGVVNAGGKLSVWLKTQPDQYYYLAK